MIDDDGRARFDGPRELEAWLEEHQDDSDGVWLLLSKKGAGFTTVTYAEAVELGLRYGWIDGQAKRVDDESYVQRFTPRRSQSVWSARNVRAAEQLITDGRMTRRGLAEVERARADGRWQRAYDGPRDAEQHPEFLAALEARPKAAAVFATLSSRNRYAIYFSIQSAKRDQTRARRIAAFVERLERGERVFG